MEFNENELVTFLTKTNKELILQWFVEFVACLFIRIEISAKGWKILWIAGNSINQVSVA